MVERGDGGLSEALRERREVHASGGTMSRGADGLGRAPGQHQAAIVAHMDEHTVAIDECNSHLLGHVVLDRERLWCCGRDGDGGVDTDASVVVSAEISPPFPPPEAKEGCGRTFGEVEHECTRRQEVWHVLQRGQSSVAREARVARASVDIVEMQGCTETREGVRDDVLRARPMLNGHARVALELGHPALTLGVLGVLVAHQVLQRAMVGVRGEVTPQEVDAEVSHSLAQRPPLAVRDAPRALGACEAVRPVRDGTLEPVLVHLRKHSACAIRGGICGHDEGP